jgi:peptidoglycan-N-acetylglucosamine deacetylase
MDKIRTIDRQKPMVALTFDDGPHLTVTPRILKALKTYDGLGTFFILGNRVQKERALVRDMYIQGHELANHTYEHKQLTLLSTDEIIRQMTKTEQVIFEVVGAGTRVMRPPYGAIDETVAKHIKWPMIMWTLDTLDWDSKDSDLIIKRTLDNIKDGDIVLMHDMYLSTAIACETIIPELVKRGYQLVTVSELCKAKDIELINGKAYD